MHIDELEKGINSWKLECGITKKYGRHIQV